jgi:hypothetical protein
MVAPGAAYKVMHVVTGRRTYLLCSHLLGGIEL